MGQYKTGDTVLYSTHGICQIQEQVRRMFGGESREYYVLKPVYAPDSTIFVPVENAALVAKMRRILSAAEIRALIQAMPEENVARLEEETQRKERFRQILGSGDRAAMVRMIKAIYEHQKAQQKKGRRLHLSDERYMKEAEKILYEEFAYVLHISPEQVLPFILEKIQVEEKTEEGALAK